MTTYRRGLSLLCIVAMLMALPLFSLAEPPPVYNYVVNTNSLNLRSGPGYEYAILGSAPRNEMVQVFHYENAYQWARVSILSSGLNGYMNAAYLSATPQSGGGMPGNARAMVKNPSPTGFLNLRETPSYSAKVLGIYYNGTLCTVLSQTGGWYHVQMDNGLRGYFRGEFLSFDYIPSEPPPPPAGNMGTARVTSSGGRVNLRQGPGYSYPVLASYYPGKIVTVYSKGTGFWQVSVDGLMGYMDSRFLRTTSSGGGSGSGNATVKSGARLNLRETPSTSARILGVYRAGTAVRVERQGLEWCQVSIPSTGARGYFMTKFLSLQGLPEIPTKVVKHPSGSYVNLRSLPSKVTGAVNMRMPHNSVVTMLSPGSVWSRVRFGTVNGYVMTSFLK